MRIMEERAERAATIVVDAVYHVYRALGPGHLESVYENALVIELRERGLPFERQVGFQLKYKGEVVGAGRHVSRPAGEWNTMEINCRGTSYRVIHNGVVIVDANEKQFPELKERFTQGYLGLQNHSEEVAFRNLRIGPPQDAYVYSYKSRREMRARRHFRRAR